MLWCLLPCLLAPSAPADTEHDVDTILARVRHAYRLAPAYRSEGTVTSHIIEADEGRETTITGRFTLQLGRPRLYRITWSQQIDPFPAEEGAVWNAGDGARLWLAGPGTCSTMTDDRVALASATGVSMGVANFIPHLFFDLGEGTDPLGRLTGPEHETDTEIDGHPCHVIKATLSDAITVRLWVDAATHELRRIENAFGGTPRLDLTPEEEEETLRAMGSEINEENRRELRAAMARARAALGNVRGKTVQDHRRIDMVGVPERASYEVALPEGVNATNSLPAAAAEEASP